MGTSSYAASDSARALKMSYEQFIVANALFQDAPRSSSIPAKRFMAQAIRNKYNDPTQAWGKSVQEIPLTIKFTDSNNTGFLEAIQAANPNIFANVPASNNFINSYDGGRVGFMAPDGAIEWSTEIEGTTFYKVTPTQNVGQNNPQSVETRMEIHTKSNYEDFLIAAWLKDEHPDAPDNVKVAVAAVIKNMARELNLPVSEVLRIRSDEIPVPYQLDNDWNINNLLMRSFAGNPQMPDLPDLNGWEPGMRLDGAVKKVVLIAGVKFLVVNPSRPAKLINT